MEKYGKVTKVAVMSRWWFVVAVLTLVASACARDGDDSGGSPTSLISPPTSTPAIAAAAGERFQTLPPGSQLPSSGECAARVRPTPENVPENAEFNGARGWQVGGLTYISQGDRLVANGFEARIDGDFVGSTDEILQWGACKWGFDEDIVKAQSYAESSWYAGRLGDCGETTQERTGGVGGCSSVGLFQVRSAEVEGTFHPGVYPGVLLSSAMNVDYALAVKRLCFEGYEEWLTDYSFNPEGYAAGDEWGCIGRWFSGNFRDDLALGYIGAVQNELAARNWESQFVGCPDWETTFYCSGLPLPVATN